MGQLEAVCIDRLSLSCIRMTDRFTARTVHTPQPTLRYSTLRDHIHTYMAASAARAVDLGAARLSEAAEVLLDRRRLMHQRNEVGTREGEQFTRVGGSTAAPTTAATSARQSSRGRTPKALSGSPLPPSVPPSDASPPPQRRRRRCASRQSPSPKTPTPTRQCDGSARRAPHPSAPPARRRELTASLSTRARPPDASTSTTSTAPAPSPPSRRPSTCRAGPRPPPSGSRAAAHSTSKVSLWAARLASAPIIWRRRRRFA